MSNPGVIVLSKKRLNRNTSFIVEDNIGEAIHLHYGDIRVDLTVQNYLKLCDNVIDSLKELIMVDGFDIKRFDPVFLDMISSYLFDLEYVEFKKVMLKDLQIQTKIFFGIPVIRNLYQSRVYKALNGNSKEEEEYIQENLMGETNLQRVEKIHNSIKQNGYPQNNEYIVLFNNQNIIRDGQHRAASMLFEYGNQEVDVMVMHFKQNKYCSSMHPWLRYIFTIDKKRIKGVLKMGYVFLRKIYHYIKR